MVRRRKTIALENLSKGTQEFEITANFRYPNDEALNAISLSVPKGVIVSPGEIQQVPVDLEIISENLLDNQLNSGDFGADPAPLTAQEFDGYIEFTNSDQTIRIPWQILPFKSSRVVAPLPRLTTEDDGTGVVALVNRGVGVAQPDVFSLIATSENLPEGGPGESSPVPDIRAVGVATFANSGCEAGFSWTFAINNHETRNHIRPVRFLINLDTDRDGNIDYRVFNADAGDDINEFSDGRQLAYSSNSDGLLISNFSAVHSMNSANMQLTVCGEQLGLTLEDIGTRVVDISVQALDIYFGGPGDSVEGISVIPGGERFLGVSEDIPGQSIGVVEFIDRGQIPEITAEIGLMVITDSPREAGSGSATTGGEAVLLFGQQKAGPLRF